MSGSQSMTLNSASANQSMTVNPVSALTPSIKIPEVKISAALQSGGSEIAQLINAIKDLTVQMNNNFSQMNDNILRMRTDMSDIQATLSTAAEVGRENQTQIKQVTAISVEHNNRLNIIEGNMSKIQNDVLKEVSARLNCQNNIIIFSMHEDTKTSANEIKINDMNLLNHLFEYMLIRDLVNIKTGYRIGKFVKNSPKTRPFKVVFNSTDEFNIFVDTF